MGRLSHASEAWRGWSLRVLAPAAWALAVLAGAVPADAQLLRPPRVPVLLVPGWSDDAEVLEPLRQRFLENGWEEEAVVALGFQDPVGSSRTHAREIGRAIHRLRKRTGASRVDVVAHSMGGLALRYHLLQGGSEDVRRAVFLATPHRGTVSSYLAWGEGATEMRPGSAFLLELMRGRPVPRGVRALTLHTPLDLHVLPAESVELPGVPDIEVCCPTHAGLLDHARTFELIRNFLESP